MQDNSVYPKSPAWRAVLFTCGMGALFGTITFGLTLFILARGWLPVQSFLLGGVAGLLIGLVGGVLGLKTSRELGISVAIMGSILMAILLAFFAGSALSALF